MMHSCASNVGVWLVLLSTLLAAAKASELPCEPQCDHGECKAYLGNLSCECYGNWSGADCSTFICDEEGNKCLNGGTCFPGGINDTQYLCSCPLPYFGSICQYTLKGNTCTPDLCNGSTCYDLAAGGYQCMCDPGWWGVSCNYSTNSSVPKNRCTDPNLCNGNGQCVWDQKISTHFSGCVCDPGWDLFGHCKRPKGLTYCDEHDGTTNAFCSNFGVCSYVFGNNTETGEYESIDYYCTCDAAHQGKNCSEPFDICNPSPCVSGTCTPIEGGHYYECNCPPGRKGYKCEYFDDPCENFECENEGTCVPDHPISDGVYNSSDASCLCCSGFGGSHCEINIGLNHTLCQPNPCLNGGRCTSQNDSYKCVCDDNYTGANCEYLNLCQSSPCDQTNTEDCLTTSEGFVCVCKTGWGGSQCRDDIDECLTQDPCLNGGTCVNSPGGYSCSCPPEYTDMYCSQYVNRPVNCSSSQRCNNGGTCVDKENGTMVCVCPTGYTGDVCNILTCRHNDCRTLATNGICDEKCFNEECGYDGREGACLPGNVTDPWENCYRASKCRKVSEDGVCDPDCNTRDCLFDSYDCIPHEECPANTVASCMDTTDNGRCDDECNTPACPFDSEDCDSRVFLKGRLLVYITGPADLQFINNATARAEFTRVIGIITNSNPVIEDIDTLSAKDGEMEGIVVRPGYNLYRVTLRLDIEYCTDQCPESVDEAGKFLDAYYASGNNIAGYDYVKSDPEPDDEPSTGSPNPSVAIVVTVVVVSVLGLFVVGGVLVGKRKIRAKIFYPGQSQVDDTARDPSPPSKRRKTNSSLTSNTLVTSAEDASITTSGSSGDYIREGSKAAKMDRGNITWKDFRVPVEGSLSRDPSNTAVVSQVGEDAREWNHLHYSAVRNPEAMRQLLEKCRSDGKKWDFNTPGPGGYTPLMLAVTQKSASCESFNAPSRSSSSSDSSGDVSEQNTLLSPLSKNNQLVPRSDTSSPSLTNGSAPSSPLNCSVDALLSAGVKLDSTNDYGRTALHLAAVCARGDYVKKLLAAGANPNIQDNWGQSSLHAAIGAAAEGAFHILTNFPKTDINLKSDGGTTPLMDAVKATNSYMVKQLVKKNADISIADYEGRTAVHWAAMVNNTEALKLLIRQGPDTIKDTQDNKGQTALFLACREGAQGSVKHLLDVFANTTLLDNLDRSPMAIAFERQHHHIMEMLKTSGPYYQLPANGRHPHAVPHHIQMVHHQEMALRQQQASLAHSSIPHDMMVEMQPMAMADQLGRGRPSHRSPEMQAPQGQTFGDIDYPVSSSMDLGLPGSASVSTSMFLSNMHPTATDTVYTPSAQGPQSFHPPLSSSQLPPSTEHPSPPTTYHQHPSPPTQPPHTTSDLPMTYSQPLAAPPGSAYPSYSTSATANHFPVSSTISDSEQRMVSELITSISNDLPPQQTPSNTTTATCVTRPLQHIDMNTNLPAYTTTLPSSTSDPYAHTSTQVQLYSPPQQPHSASSVHSNRSPSSALYPSPPNSDTLQHSEMAPQSGMAMQYAHASPPSLTPSPETRDELARKTITTVEGLVQQHDYPTMSYMGGDPYHYNSIRFQQDYNNETTV